MPQARFKDPKTAPRVGDQTARRELEVLSAAIGYAHKEHKIDYSIVIALPKKAPAKERFLTRSEAARLLWAAWRGEAKHAARFILIGLYTGTRHDAILNSDGLPRSMAAGSISMPVSFTAKGGAKSKVRSGVRRPCRFHRGFTPISNTGSATPTGR